MDTVENFRTVLRQVWEQTSNKTATARALGVTRQEIYKYLNGTVIPRAGRRKVMSVTLRRLSGQSAKEPKSSEIVALSPKRALRMRQLLVELLDLLDLDEEGHGGTLRKDG